MEKKQQTTQVFKTPEKTQTKTYSNATISKNAAVEPVRAVSQGSSQRAS